MLSNYSIQPKETFTTPTATVYRVVEIYEKYGRDASGNIPIFIKPENPAKKK